MKDFLIELVSAIPDNKAKVNTMREYLQLYALRNMFENNNFLNLTFVGGTALRFAYNLPRFSEDVDFSLADKTGYDFKTIMNNIKRTFEDAAYTLVIKYDDTKTVNSAFIKFPELMYLAGISHRREQNLSIKLEVDTNPPLGASSQQTVMTKYFPITLTHYDLPSLFSGKVHALLTRSYTKGRDYFDIAWILSKWRDMKPNLKLLSEALKQTGYQGEVTVANWKDVLKEKTRETNWDAIHNEVSQFAESVQDIKILLTPEHFLSLL